MLRKLELHDAPQMFERMHDEIALLELQPEKFKKIFLFDCESFTILPSDEKENIHRTIVDDNEECGEYDKY
jgi:hypothetical protein